MPNQKRYDKIFPGTIAAAVLLMLLGVILAFFGCELVVLFGRDALKGKRTNQDVSDSDTE